MQIVKLRARIQENAVMGGQLFTKHYTFTTNLSYYKTSFTWKFKLVDSYIIPLLILFL